VIVTTTSAAQEAAFHRVWERGTGLRGFFTAVQHQDVGRRYMITAFFLFLLGGVQALLMRLQLSTPDTEFLDAETYNELFTMHGTTMMFLFAVPFLEGLATYLLPLKLGARDMPFPRYNAFNYWCYLAGGLILYSSFLVDLVPDAGWFAYVPLSGPEFSDKAMDIWLFGLTLAEIAAVGAAIEIIVAVLKMRAPGMSLDKLPVFAWTMLSVAVLIMVAFVPLIVASLLLELDRSIGTAFFDPDLGGSPLLWQHLFWIFGHPEVYVMFLPGAAIISHVIPVHARRRLAAYPFVVVAVVVTAIMSLGLWVHHMYATGLPPLTLSFFTAASMSIGIASGVQVFAWIATLWLGRPRLTVPMLYALGFVVTFVAGGITGIMVASAPFDAQAHDTYFIVAHLHYVLIGGMLFPIFAGLYHWWPKLTGRMVDDTAGRWSFWLVFIGFHVTFFPMHLSGLWGMPRRVYTYEAELDIGFVNLLSTVGAFILAVGVLVLVAALLVAARRGRPAGDDPWRAETLEWATSSPPPPSNFPELPVVVGGRSPLWDRRPEPDEYREVREAFDHRPTDRRSSPLVAAVSGAPVGAALLATPTVWPLVPAVGLAVLITGLLVEAGVLFTLGLLVVLGGTAGWMWRNEQEHSESSTRPVGGFAIEGAGPAATGWWAAVGTAVTLVVGVTTIAFSMVFLQVNSGTWAGAATLDQPLLTTAAGLLTVAGLAATWWGSRRGLPGTSDGAGVRAVHLASAVVALLSGIGALAVLLVTWQSSGLVVDAHAYSSGVFVSLAAQGLVLLFAVGISAAALLSRLVHRRDSRPALMLQNSAIVWVAAVVAWLTTWLTATVFPAVI